MARKCNVINSDKQNQINNINKKEIRNVFYNLWINKYITNKEFLPLFNLIDSYPLLFPIDYEFDICIRLINKCLKDNVSLETYSLIVHNYLKGNYKCEVPSYKIAFYLRSFIEKMVNKEYIKLIK